MATDDSTPRTIEIQLTKGYVAIVDEQDADLVLLKWHKYTNIAGNNYARKAELKTNSKSKHRPFIHMHRVILERVLQRSLDRYEYVDHINGDGLDNRRSNLRVSTTAQNARNQKIRSNNTSGYKGVTYVKKSKVWAARITLDSKRIGLGSFSTAEDAGCVYNYYALKYHGAFARLNLIDNWEQRANDLLLLGTQRPQSNNTSGYRGVDRISNKWRAYFNANGKRVHVGLFDSPEDAYKAKIEAIREYFK